MERIKTISFLHFWSLLGLLAMIAIWFLPWRFQVNDDVIMMWLVSGAYTGTPESYAVFIHPLLSWIFSKFYTFHPEFNWYGATWFLAIFFSYGLFLRRIGSTSFSMLWKSFFALMILVISLHFSYFPQFTLVGGYLGLSGLITFFQASFKTSKLNFYLGLLAIFLSIIIRAEAFVLVGMGFFLGELIFSDKVSLSRNRLRFLFVGVVFISCLASKWIYEKNSVYVDYLEFNQYRSAVIDHPAFYDLERNGGFESEDKWFYFSRWMFEEEGITIYDLKEKASELNKSLWTVKHFRNSLERLWLIQRTEMFKSMLILMLILLLLLSKPNTRKLVIYASIWSLFFFFFNTYFLILGRVIFLFFIVLFSLIFNYGHFRKHESLAYGFIAAMLFFFSFHTINFLKEAEGREKMNLELNEMNDEIPTGAPLFLEGYFEFNLPSIYNWKNPVPVVTYGWISRSPFQKKAFQRFGFDKLSNLSKYYFIGIQIPEPLVLPDYIESLAGTFEQKELARSSSFVLFELTKSSLQEIPAIK